MIFFQFSYNINTFIHVFFKVILNLTFTPFRNSYMDDSEPKWVNNAIQYGINSLRFGDLYIIFKVILYFINQYLPSICWGRKGWRRIDIHIYMVWIVWIIASHRLMHFCLSFSSIQVTFCSFLGKILTSLQVKKITL